MPHSAAKKKRWSMPVVWWVIQCDVTGAKGKWKKILGYEKNNAHFLTPAEALGVFQHRHHWGKTENIDFGVRPVIEYRPCH